MSSILDKFQTKIIMLFTHMYSYVELNQCGWQQYITHSFHKHIGSVMDSGMISL